MLFRTLVIALIVHFSHQACLGAIYRDAGHLPLSLTYDFIVVGGGTAGNVVANRLTENPRVSVLVIEAGPSNENVILSQVPFLCTRLLNTEWDYNYTTTPQAALNGRQIPMPRGFILGGSSSINFLLWTRGSKDDFDRFATVSGDDGWSWDSMQHYIYKTEKWIQPADHHNTTGQFDPSAHRSIGINSVGIAGFPREIDSKVVETTKDLEAEFPFLLDMNAGRPLGVGWAQVSVKDGARSSSATSYLGPQFITRPNLHVLVSTRVKRLLMTPLEAVQTPPMFTTVEFVGSDGITQRLTATKEVILSAGAINSPQLLLISGIGDKTELNKIGINAVVDLPDVGKNLYDHPIITVSWSVTPNGTTFDDVNRNQTLFNETLKQWNSTRTGQFINARLNHVGWARLDTNDPILARLGDPSAGVNTPHIELGISNGFTFSAQVPPTGHFISMFAAVVSPASHGSLTINSTDIFQPPLIDPAILSSEFDVYTIREGVKRASRFLSAPPWQGYVLEPFGGFANATTDDTLDAFIRANAMTVKHPVGTAAMSRKSAKTGVVDPDLKVKRVKGLRVVDASVFPFIPSGHTQAPTYIVAERAADLIKQAWGLGVDIRE